MLKRAANPLAGLALAISLGLAVFGGRLYWLQVVQYRQYATLSQENRIALETIRAMRGQVYARDGKTLLIGNRAAVDLVYKGGEVRYFDKIATLAGLTEGLPKLGSQPEKVLKANLPESAVYGLAEWAAGQPSLELRTRIERLYPTHTSGNLLGYTRPADDRPEDKTYHIDDLVGAAGVERGLENLLRGQNGLKYIEVDAHGREVRESIEREAVPGQDVALTIDAQLQKAAERAVGEAKEDINRLNRQHKIPEVREARGAIVALDPRTGEILALATGPRFDPNWFSRRPAPPEAQRVQLDLEYKPMWNRAVKIYEPGSTFKLVTSSALLEGGWGNPTYTCVGGWGWGGRTWHNWTGRNLGTMDTRGAIQNSCNTWYYQAAAGAGVEPFGEAIAKRAQEFGFGEPTAAELPGEQTGRLPQTDSLPSPSSYRRAGIRWENGFTLNYSIGQGDMRASPLQVARMLATIVNDGRRPELTLVKSVGGKARPPKPSVQVPGKHWSVLKEGMSWTVLRRGGTANHVLGPSFYGRELFPVPTGGKTGTAQNPAGRNQDHAWYMGYGPLTNPELVVVAFFENGVEGSGVALPAVKKVMAAYWGVELDERGNPVKPQVARVGR